MLILNNVSKECIHFGGDYMNKESPEEKRERMRQSELKVILRVLYMTDSIERKQVVQLI